VLGMFVEIAGTEQMTTAGFHVISFHLPCRFPGGRGQEDQHTQHEKAYLHPASHIHLLLFWNKFSNGPDLLWWATGFYCALSDFASAGFAGG
jgi:hypothetical protein